MSHAKADHFDEAAANWDAEPRRIELAHAVGEAVLRQVRLTPDMDILDYGCGTGLLGLFLLPHVRSVTGADSSPGMLRVLEAKIRAGGLRRMRAQRLDLGHDPVPELPLSLDSGQHGDAPCRPDRRVVGGILPDVVAWRLFWPLPTWTRNRGCFMVPMLLQSVFHHGFDRHVFMDCMCQVGLVDVTDMTAHVIRKPTANGEMREFPVFLIVGRRTWSDRVSL